LNTNQEKLLNEICNADWNEFTREISTDENKDYRRGFKAGALFSALKIRHVLNHLAADPEESNYSVHLTVE
jgi:hypothetical protein